MHLQCHDKIVVLLDGRDAAGKDGNIKRVVEHLSQRETRVVALGTPSSSEQTGWHLQRDGAHLPVAEDFVLFNRSWYNRAGVEHVMGFCTKDESMLWRLNIGKPFGGARRDVAAHHHVNFAVVHHPHERQTLGAPEPDARRFLTCGLCRQETQACATGYGRRICIHTRLHHRGSFGSLNPDRYGPTHENQHAASAGNVVRVERGRGRKTNRRSAGRRERHGGFRRGPGDGALRRNPTRQRRHQIDRASARVRIGSDAGRVSSRRDEPGCDTHGSCRTFIRQFADACCSASVSRPDATRQRRIRERCSLRAGGSPSTGRRREDRDSRTALARAVTRRMGTR